MLSPGQTLREWWFSKTDRQLPAKQERAEHLLPSMRRVSLELKPNELFQPKAFNPSLSIHQNTCTIFKLLSEVMLPSAFFPHSASSPVDQLPADYLKDPECVHMWPWANPLLEDVTEQVQQQNTNRQVLGRHHAPECMHASRTRVAMHSQAEMAEGYVAVLLGYLKQADTSSTHPWTPVYEGAHRLVYWAMLGGLDHKPSLWEGAAEGQKAGPVVLHSCHNRACLQPYHLTLGSYSENRQRPPKQSQRLERGQRLPPWQADYRAAFGRRAERAGKVAGALAGAVETCDL